MGRPGFWYGVPFLNARQFFLGQHMSIEFGQALAFGKTKADEIIPDLRSKTGRDYDEMSLYTLWENLCKFKWEISGHYKRQVLTRS